MTQKRLVLIVGGVLAALLIAVLVTLVVLLNTMNSQADQRAFESCMTQLGYPVDAPPSDADGMLDAAGACMR